MLTGKYVKRGLELLNLVHKKISSNAWKGIAAASKLLNMGAGKEKSLQW